MNQKFLEAKIVTETLLESKEVKSDCLSIAFKNNGTITAYVNDVKVSAGTSLEVDMPDNYLDKTIYRVKFETGTGARLDVVRILPFQKQ